MDGHNSVDRQTHNALASQEVHNLVLSSEGQAGWV